MARFGLNDELGVGEQLGELSDSTRGCAQVDLPGEQQHRRVEPSKRRAGGLRVKSPCSAEGVRGLLVLLFILGCLMGLRHGVPPAVEEGRDRRPVVGGGLAGSDRLEGWKCSCEPRLLLAESSDRTSGLARGRNADGHGTRGDYFMNVTATPEIYTLSSRFVAL